MMAPRPGGPWENPLQNLQPVEIAAVIGHHVDQISVEAVDHSLRGFAQPHCAGGDGVERWLDVGRRARDHSQDLGRGGLLLQRLGHLRMGLLHRAILVLQFGEQADVLDRDHRLRCERLEEGDLPV
jgi:hypothetical protein